MTSIEIARRFAALEQTKDAIDAYMVSLHTSEDPLEKLEAASFIMDKGGNYKVSYTVFVNLYQQGHFRDMILPLLEKAFYEPNVRLLKSRYERNCKRLRKYPYIFRKDFPAFEDLPIRFFPFDDHHGYVPFYPSEERFGDFVNVRDAVIGRNFFKDLEKPILASDVYSQYELEYLNDMIRPSEWVGRENHIYLHYIDWETFCAWLQVLNVKPLTESKKAVFLIGDELSRYPIDFQAEYGIDYSKYPVKPVGIREVNKLIWHTQLSTHNGGDFFNEIFDDHPNLMAMPSIIFDEINHEIDGMRGALNAARDARDAQHRLRWEDEDIRLAMELYNLRDRTDKDILVALFLHQKLLNKNLDTASRIVPAIFFQPHFSYLTYGLNTDRDGNIVLHSDQYEEIHSSPMFLGFKYIKTFTPMRRPTTSYGATVKFMYETATGKRKAYSRKKDKDAILIHVVSDMITKTILNRSFMIDSEDRLYHDSVLVRFEDGKLNPKATFTALAAFLDIPYTDSMAYCSLAGERDPESQEGNDLGFSTAAVYRTYDEYANDSERYFLEFFLRDAYAFYGYDFLWYDGTPVDINKVECLVDQFTTADHYIQETWRTTPFLSVAVSKNGEQTEWTAKFKDFSARKELLDSRQDRLNYGKILLRDLRFVNRSGQPLRMMPKLELDPALLEQPLYH